MVVLVLGNRDFSTPFLGTSLSGDLLPLPPQKRTDPSFRTFFSIPCGHAPPALLCVRKPWRPPIPCRMFAFVSSSIHPAAATPVSSLRSLSPLVERPSLAGKGPFPLQGESTPPVRHALPISDGQAEVKTSTISHLMNTLMIFPKVPAAP